MYQNILTLIVVRSLTLVRVADPVLNLSTLDLDEL